MALAARRDTAMSVSEYRVWVEAVPDSERWELLAGEPVLMSPPRERHQRITTNLIVCLHGLAKPKGCGVYPGLAILSDAMDDFAPIPDVVVRCGPDLPDGYARDPLLIVEVLSPTTMAIDRGIKAEFYRTVPSLQTYLIVYQNEPRIEVWRREADWDLRVARPGDAIDLPELDGRMAVDDVYDRVAF